MRYPIATLNYALTFGILLFLIGVAVFAGIRQRILSPAKAALVMFLFPIIYETLVVLLQKGEHLQIFCDGLLLSLTFGSATYVFGVILEKWTSNST
jgi:uncharacterized membrane protein